MSYLKEWLGHVLSSAAGGAGGDRPVRSVATFAAQGITHSTSGLVIGLDTGGRLYAQTCWAGPQPLAVRLGATGPSPPGEPHRREGLVPTTWVEHWLAHAIALAHPDAQVARYSTHPTLRTGHRPVGVIVHMPGDRRVFAQFVWTLRANEEPHRALKWRSRDYV